MSHQNYPKHGSKLPPDWPVYPFHFEIDFGLHARTFKEMQPINIFLISIRNESYTTKKERKKKKHTQIMKQVLTFSEHGVCPDEWCMTMRQQQ